MEDISVLLCRRYQSQTKVLIEAGSLMKHENGAKEIRRREKEKSGSGKPAF